MASTTTEAPDLTEFFKLSKPKRPPCQVRLIIEGELPPKLKPMERKQLKAACEQNKSVITAPAIREWLKARKHDITDQRIVNHRLGKCDCEDV